MLIHCVNVIMLLQEVKDSLKEEEPKSDVDDVRLVLMGIPLVINIDAM